MTSPRTLDLGRDCMVTMLPEGRLQLQQGPINLVVKAYGSEPDVRAAYQRAIGHFPTILERLAANLPILKQPIDAATELSDSPAGERMLDATSPYKDRFVTPMACVAGAVADDVLSVIASTPGIERVFVNNGGDIALHLAAGHTISIGVVPSLVDAVSEGKITVHHGDGIGGIATSGWMGPSHSLGIADAVTVLARNAASADVAATLIANEVNLDSKLIERARACDLDDTSDLGDLLVTTAVGSLSPAEKRTALDAGVSYANTLIDQGLIVSALMNVQGQWATAGQSHKKTIASQPRQDPLLQQKMTGS